MEIAQRSLSSFEERTIFNNKVSCEGQKAQCINCHSYQNYRTDNMLFHVRVTNGGTIIVNDGNLSKVDLKRDNTISPGVYPSWHPTEKLVAFSTNTTRQMMHTVNKNKTEVFDLASDLILYDIAKDEVSVVSDDTTRLEVFPTWSPDGKFLYYCSTLSDSVKRNIKSNYKNLKYNLYRRSFDVKTRQFGDEELVYDAASSNHSVSLPRVSPDGRHIIFAQGSYGCFNIWHHDADVKLIDVPVTANPSSVNIEDLPLLNSKDFAESYPTWSSNGKWIMCASRRDDGNYSRVYISYYDGKKAHKAFELPQSDPEHNTRRLKSYNRPEFMVEPVKHSISDFKYIVEKE
jgi:Tol biopolymer transport system component